MSAVGRLASVIAIVAFWVSPIAGESFHPARYQDGVLPVISPMIVGGGEVALELTVAIDGTVRGIRALRVTPAYTEALIRVIKGWRFVPAQIDRAGPASTSGGSGLIPVESTVLVVGMFRAPTWYAPTLGDLPRDVASELDGTPFPIVTSLPPYPPLMRNGGLVLVEAEVDVNGHTGGSRAIQSNPPFDKLALETLRQWTFRPARIRGLSTPTLVYVIFGFQPPVAGPLTPMPAPTPAPVGPAAR